MVVTSLSARDARRLQDASLPPVVVVTEDPLATAYRLRRVVVQEIVGDDPEEIAGAIRRGAASSVFERAARVADEHPRYSPLLRWWMARTLRAYPPFTGIEASLRGTGVTCPALERHWRRDIGISSPKRWTGWMQLARAPAISHGKTWTWVARRLGITLRTLERLAYRLTGRTLDDLAADPHAFRAEFERYLAKILTGDTA